MANQLVLVGTVDAGVMRVRVSTAFHGIGLSVVGLSEHKAFHFHFRLVAPAADLLSGVLRSACDGESSDREVDDFDVQVRVGTTTDHRIGLSVARGRDAVFHFTLNKVEAQKLSDLIHEALVRGGHFDQIDRTAPIKRGAASHQMARFFINYIHRIWQALKAPM